MGCKSVKDKDSEKEPAKKAVELSETEKAINECRQCCLNMKNTFYCLSSTRECKMRKAKEILKNKDKDKALIYIKLSKFHDEQIKVVLKELGVVEDQIKGIETSDQFAEVMIVLQNCNTAYKKIQDDVKINQWTAFTEDFDVLEEQQVKIGEFFAQNNVNQAEFDINANSELEKLEKEIEYETKHPVYQPYARSNQASGRKKEKKEKAKNRSKRMWSIKPMIFR